MYIYEMAPQGLRVSLAPGLLKFLGGPDPHNINKRLIKESVYVQGGRRRGQGEQAPLLPFAWGNRGSKSTLSEMQ